MRNCKRYAFLGTLGDESYYWPKLKGEYGKDAKFYACAFYRGCLCEGYC